MKKRNKEKSVRRKNREKLIKPNQIISRKLRIERDEIGTHLLIDKTEKKYLHVVMITGCDIMNYQQNDMQNAFFAFAGAETSIRNYDHKYIFTDNHPKLDAQKQHVLYRLERATNPKAREILERELSYFDACEALQNDSQAYLLVYSTANTYNEAKNDVMRFIQSISMYVGAHLLNDEETISFLKAVMHGTDSDSIPNVVVSDNYYVVNENEYCTTITVHGFPSILDDLTFADLFSRLKGSVVTLDCKMDTRETTMEELKRSLREIDSRSSINQEVADEINNEQDLSELAEIYSNVRSANERMIKATLKVHLSTATKKELEDKIAAIVSKLTEIGLETHINENNMLSEYFSRIVFENEIKISFPLQDTFKKQFPFYYQSHIDDNGMYFGQTYTDGMVILDTFLKNHIRTSFDLLLIGVKGSGKSMALKAMSQDVLALGHRLLCLDIEGEYHALCQEFGGNEIKLVQSSIINPLELRRSLVAELEDNVRNVSAQEAIASNYTSELSRITVFFSQYIPSISDIELDELKDMLTEMYSRFGITAETNTAELSPEDFPIMSDLLAIIREKLYDKDGNYRNGLSESKRSVYEKLESHIKGLAEGIYSGMFNGHSTVKITDSDLTVFNVSALSELEDRVVNAELFLILSLMWSEICDNVVRNKNIVNPYDRSYVVAEIDEAHRYINSKNPTCTKFIEKCTRRTRKYDAGLWFASQSINDFFPSGDFSGAETIKNIFSLVQYKMILKQSSESVESLHYAFPQFTKSELMATDSFEPGEMLMHIGGREKLRCKREIDPDDFRYLGNSRDNEGGDKVG